MLWNTRSCIVLLKCTAYLDKKKKKNVTASAGLLKKTFEEFILDHLLWQNVLGVQ